MPSRRSQSLTFALATSVAVAIWALAAARGCARAMIWLPAAVAGAVWPADHRKTRVRCVRRLRRRRGRQ